MRPGGRSRLRRYRQAWVRHAILLAWTFFIVFPLYWMLSTSFKDAGEWGVVAAPLVPPHEFTIHNYRQIFTFSALGEELSRDATEQAFSIWKALGDSLLICSVASFLALVLGVFLAYAISRFAVGGSKFRHIILTIRMVPPIVIAIPILMYYAIMIPFTTELLFGARITLFDTYFGLGALYVATTLPFVIWMMLSFIDEVPFTLEHAARMMGAGRMYTLRAVVLPLVASGLVVTYLFVFILNWSEFLLALTLTSSRGDDAPGSCSTSSRAPRKAGSTGRRRPSGR